jgi:tryptophanase
MPRPIVEPFRIKMVEPIRLLAAKERRRVLEGAGYNLFGLRADDVLIDLLTDSGTGAMSAEQWAAMMRGDESYAGARSWERFKSAVEGLTGFETVFPTHQGRAAERILCDVVPLKGRVVLSNGLFDTTRANVEAAGATGLDLPLDEGLSNEDVPLAGGIRLDVLRRTLAERKGEVAFVVMTITNNTLGGQAVSLANLREASAMCRAAKVPMVLDACRFAENAWAIRRDEPAERRRPLASIAREMFDLADLFTMSAKKDAIVNMGGMLGVRDPRLAEELRTDLVRTEGFPTYGGLAGRDLDAIAQGLHEVLDEDYLAYRFAASAYLASALERSGWPILRPAAAHAVYVDAGAALPHLSANDLPGQSLACGLYLAGGIRSCEIGNLMFGPGEGRRQLVRLALPRRVYTQSHVDWVAAIFEELGAARKHLPAMRIVKEPRFLRHFTATLAPATPFADFAD